MFRLEGPCQVLSDGQSTWCLKYIYTTTTNVYTTNNNVYTTLSNPGCVAAVMGHSAQAALANTLFHMKVRRSELLELPWV
jgi:hypothetical protein